MSSPDPVDTKSQVDGFVRLLTENQRRISLYVLGLVPRWNDAEEILQETNLVLWRDFARFEPGTNFAAWACKVAFHQVLAWRKRQSRDRLRFSFEFLEAVSEESIAAADRLESRANYLRGCLEKLPAKNRELLRLRYAEGCSMDELARRLGRTIGALYRVLSRIRKVLHVCVNRSFALEDRS